MKVIQKKVKIIGIVVAVILIIVGVTAVIMLMRSSLPDPKILSEIRSGLKVGRSTIDKTNQDIIAKNTSNIANFANEAYPRWDTDRNQLSELTKFAIGLLELNVTGDILSKCQSIVKSIINSIINQLKLKVDLSYQAPWGGNWYPFSVYVTRLFATYEYLGDDLGLQKQCHHQLTRITPYIGRSFGRTHQGENLFYVAVPRLCSNYLSEPKKFIEDQKDDQFQNLKKYLEFSKITTNELKEGRYADGSWISSGNVASYHDIRKYDEYHERNYRLLGFSTGIKEGAESIFPKLLHPNIPYLPLGLVGRSGKVYNYKRYPNITSSETGVFVMPFMGFGIFKTPDFLFYVRVQRPGIAAFQSKKVKDDDTDKDKNMNKLGLGWVQLRKLYRKSYSTKSDKIIEFTWENLKIQPGLLTFVNDSDVNLLEVFKAKNSETQSFETDQSKLNSYIGQLNADSTNITNKLLFWLNIYDFNVVYNGSCKVTEAAIVTDQGLQAYYIIENNTDKALQFACKDDQTEWIVKINNTIQNSNYIAVPASNITTFSWQVLKSNIDYKVTYTDNKLKFEFNGKNYNIEVTTPNTTYVVKENDSVILTGSMNNTS